ncbi:MAG: site-specific integrase [Clostridia bacterium]|nr:site-specific integrase [Clostridia bacterium]
MRLPSGFGGISKLPGNRRNPWRVRITTGWIFDEKTQKAKQQYKTVGYYPTRQAALQALAEYNRNPYDLDASKATFADVYNSWSDAKFEKVSDVNGYKASYKVCSALYNMKFVDIKLAHLQSVMDNCGKNAPTKKKLKTLFNQMFDYAVKNEIISKERHLAEYVDIGDKGEKSTKHTRFSSSEVDALWKWSENNEYVQVILMLIYSGVRPGELFDIKSSNVDLEEGFFTIPKGKNANAARKVPIHDRTFPFFKYWKDKGNEYLITNLSGKKFSLAKNHNGYVTPYFSPILSEIGILTYKNEKGEIQEHLPDDTRHTFTTMWKEKKLDEAMRRKIQGHSGKGIGEIVYTHFDLQVLKEELNKL